MSGAIGSEVKPSLRFAINVIDREDQQIKILEGGSTIFEHFSNWSNGHGGAHPGGEDGWDWTITAMGEGLNRKYITTPIHPAPLSEDERHRIKDKKEYYSLKEVFVGTPIDEVVAKAMNERSSGPEPSTPQASVPQASESKAEPVASGSDLAF